MIQVQGNRRWPLADGENRITRCRCGHVVARTKPRPFVAHQRFMGTAPARQLAPCPRVAQPIHEAQRPRAKIERGTEPRPRHALHDTRGVAAPPRPKGLRVGHAEQAVAPIEQEAATAGLRGVSESRQRRIEHIFAAIQRDRQCATIAQAMTHVGLHIGEVVRQLPFAQERHEAIGVRATRRHVPTGRAAHGAAQRQRTGQHRDGRRAMHAAALLRLGDYAQHTRKP